MATICTAAATELVRAAHQHAEQIGVPSTVTVLDPGGRRGRTGIVDHVGILPPARVASATERLAAWRRSQGEVG